MRDISLDRSLSGSTGNGCYDRLNHNIHTGYILSFLAGD